MPSMQFYICHFFKKVVEGLIILKIMLTEAFTQTAFEFLFGIITLEAQYCLS